MAGGARICLGQIGAAHGVRGQVRLWSFTADPAAIGRYGPLETEDGRVVLASEVGVLDIDPARVVRKGRLQPGRMFLVDTAQGRIVDDEGRPRKGIGLWSAGGIDLLAGHGILPGGNRGQGLWIGPDGRFRVEGLVPGLMYGASVMDGVIMQIGELFENLTVGPGEVRDLGDLKVIPLKRGN